MIEIRNRNNQSNLSNMVTILRAPKELPLLQENSFFCISQMDSSFKFHQLQLQCPDISLYQISLLRWLGFARTLKSLMIWLEIQKMDNQIKTNI